MGLPSREKSGGLAIREDWGTAFEVEDDLWRVRLFNERGTLLVNTYLYKGLDHLVVIDPGWPWCLDRLKAAMKHLGLGSFRDVDAWLYTHTHIDHMGPAALLARESEAPHYTWAAVEEHLESWHTFQDQTNDWYDWSQRAFAEPARTMMREWHEMDDHENDRNLVTEHGEMSVQNARLLEFGDRLQIADLEFEFVDARGHDPYHGAFYECGRRWLFAGDAVIATPTPISRAMNDDLRLYEATLDRLEALDVELLLPGHGVQKRGDLGRAFERSKKHVSDYHENVLAQLEKRDEPVGLYEICLSMTPERKPLEPIARWWVHLALVDSHLQKLVEDGLVTVNEEPRYRMV